LQILHVSLSLGWGPMRAKGEQVRCQSHVDRARAAMSLRA
jgi:hypothetical protein